MPTDPTSPAAISELQRIATALEQIATSLGRRPSPIPAMHITGGASGIEVVRPPVSTADADGWFAWEGGQRPVPEDMLVDYRFREAPNDIAGTRPAGSLVWRHDGELDDIVAYRIARP